MGLDRWVEYRVLCDGVYPDGHACLVRTGDEYVTSSVVSALKVAKRLGWKAVRVGEEMMWYCPACQRDGRCPGVPKDTLRSAIAHAKGCGFDGLDI